VNKRVFALAAAVGSALACPSWTLAQAVGEPGRLAVTVTSAHNQQIAQAIADRLRQSGRLQGYAIDITFAEGTAILTGQVVTESQRDEAVRLTRTVPGVEQVYDRLQVTAGLAQAQLIAPQGFQPQPPVPPGPMPRPESAAPLAGALPPEPTPIFQAHPPAAGLVNNPPPLPPYAWPTYAPYNNYSRVAYPQIYPYQSWPFIGPVYPFPKVPLGWRSVKLTWEDGHWWYARVGSGHDWWRIRYW
jgi:hypothetical protein